MLLSIRKRKSILLWIVPILAFAFLWVNPGRAASTQAEPTTTLDVSIAAVMMPHCVRVSERVPFYFVVTNTGTRPVTAIISPWNPRTGNTKGMIVSFAQPSLRGWPSYLYWKVVLQPGQSRRIQINLVIPDWVTGTMKGPVNFELSVRLSVVGENGGSRQGTQVLTLVPQFC